MNIFVTKFQFVGSVLVKQQTWIWEKIYINDLGLKGNRKNRPQQDDSMTAQRLLSRMYSYCTEAKSELGHPPNPSGLTHKWDIKPQIGPR